MADWFYSMATALHAMEKESKKLTLHCTAFTVASWIQYVNDAPWHIFGIIVPGMSAWKLLFYSIHLKIFRVTVQYVNLSSLANLGFNLRWKECCLLCTNSTSHYSTVGMKRNLSMWVFNCYSKLNMPHGSLDLFSRFTYVWSSVWFVSVNSTEDQR